MSKPGNQAGGVLASHVVTEVTVAGRRARPPLAASITDEAPSVDFGSTSPLATPMRTRKPGVEWHQGMRPVSRGAPP